MCSYIHSGSAFSQLTFSFTSPYLSIIASKVSSSSEINASVSIYTHTVFAQIEAPSE